MSALSNDGRRRFVLAVLLLTLALLGLALAVTVPMFIEQRAGAEYGADSFAPEQPVYCPGDVLRYEVSFERVQKGPFELVQSWCSPETGICPRALSQTYRVNTARSYPSAKIVASRIIPDLAPGQWEYVHSSRILGQRAFSMYTVPFVISERCE